MIFQSPKHMITELKVREPSYLVIRIKFLLVKSIKKKTINVTYIQWRVQSKTLNKKVQMENLVLLHMIPQTQVKAKADQDFKFT